MARHGHLKLLLGALAPERLTRIVDVGANPANVPPYRALFDLGGCEVIGFEPAPEAYAALARRDRRNETYVNAAVGDGTRRPFHIYKDETFSSVFEPDAAAMAFLGSPHWAEVTSSVEMKTVKLDQVKEIGDFDLLKIDIQGGELAVFRGGKARLAQAVAVITELGYFPIYDDAPLIGDQETELRKQGFRLHKFLHAHARCLPSSQRHLLVRSEAKDQLVDGDAVFLRNVVEHPTWTAEKVKHLCILAAGVFESHSLALMLLDDLVRRGAAEESLPRRYVEALPARFVRGRMLAAAKAAE